MKYFVGCSGFHYKDWKGKFYPEELNTQEWLSFYAEQFNTVEINNSFYKLPNKETVEHWYAQTPAHFIFTIKGSRYVTHMKKMKPGEKLKSAVQNVYDVADVLKGKLGCVLWQLPGNQHKDVEKLDRFCEILSPHFKNVMEFRHNSWYDEEVYAVLKKHEVSFCIISAPDGLKEDAVVTSDTVYARFHGKDEWYNYFYSEKEMQTWAARIKKLKGKRCYIYFNNDWNANAVENARMLREMLV